MKAIMVMFDTLNRRFLPNYGCTQTVAPNFERLGERCVTFDNCYVGSLPCMPARRELHTGRYNFLHRSWGPLEPFDDSMPELLKKAGIYTHLASDHKHYWEDGGATYHSRYSSWECFRGQEGDEWKADLNPDIKAESSFGMPMEFVGHARRQDAVNRLHMADDAHHSQTLTFDAGLEFIETNHGYDNWFLQIETFDPHEPFFSGPEFEALYPEVDFDGPDLDWPPYAPCREDKSQVDYVRRKYFALLSKCDKSLGRVLDIMDKYDLWKDTMLIVNTDHGFMLGEKDWWGKSVMPLYDEMCHTPFFVWDPRCGKAGERRKALVQTIDIAPTLLDYFGLEPTKDMQGKPLADTIVSDTPVRSHALLGFHGAAMNITDGRYVYMRAPADYSNSPLYEYTVMPTHMVSRFKVEELRTATLHPGFSFTKGCPVLRTETGLGGPQSSMWCQFGLRLYDLETDPGQQNPLDDPALEAELANEMVRLMRENDAPPEQYTRMGLPPEGGMTADMVLEQRENAPRPIIPEALTEFDWEDGAAEQYRVLALMSGAHDPNAGLEAGLAQYLRHIGIKRVTPLDMEGFASVMPNPHPMLLFLLRLVGRTF